MPDRFKLYAGGTHEEGEVMQEYDNGHWMIGCSREAAQAVCDREPLYEVVFDFEYNKETDELRCLSAFVDGQKLVPVEN